MNAHAYTIVGDSPYGDFDVDFDAALDTILTAVVDQADLAVQFGPSDEYYLILLSGDKNEGDFKNLGSVVSEIGKSILPGFKGGKNIKTHTMANPIPAPILLLATGIIGLVICRKNIFSKQ
jgi:hypothetical protein